MPSLTARPLAPARPEDASAPTSGSSRTPWLAALLADGRVFVLLGIALLLLEVAAEFRTWTSPDIAWYLYAARRMVDGARLYVDIVEINPPLIMLLNVPVVLAARALGVPEILAFRVGVVGLVLASLWLCDRVLRELPGLGLVARRWVLLLLVFVLMPLTREDFGQREHIMLALSLPYLFLGVLRAAGGRLSRPHAVALGLLAGVGMSLKPHFGLLWLAVEALVWLARRDRSLLVRPENVSAALVPVLYGVGIVLLVPEYLDLVRAVSAEYSSFLTNSIPLTLLIGQGSMVTLFSLLAYVCLRRVSVHRELAMGLALATAALLLAALLQQKGWRYHFYPALSMATVLLGVLVVGAVRQRAGFAAGVYTAFSVALLVGIVAWTTRATLAQAIDPRDVRYAPYPEFGQLERIIRERAPGQEVLVLSTNLRSAFPLINYTGAEWASRFTSMWIFGSVYQDATRLERPIAYRDRAQMGEAERFLNDAVVADVQRFDPKLIIALKPQSGMPRHPIWRLDYIAYFSRDPRFAALLQRYRPVADVGDYRVYERVASGRPGT